MTKVNAPGPALDPLELDALVEAAIAQPYGGRLAGRPLVPARGRSARSLCHTHRAGPRRRRALAVDTSGSALCAALTARPNLIKPNLSELAELVGRPLTSVDELIAAAGEAWAAGAGS